ncbi:deoxyribose-phosphate aldolase [Flavobacterium sp. RHBU_24]|uniref:deoxyribose-phosphate aldolase n=1 Tax=Flavobacterium sp. RHBU_24 TaxID=3391185 RepID=UPI003984DFEA
MDDIRQYLDSTYLKTAAQAGLTDAQNREVVRHVVTEAIEENFKLVMVRPDMVAMACEMVRQAGSPLYVGTVIDFPEGSGGLEAKRAEAAQAIKDGADELDFVVDYTAYKAGNLSKVEEEVGQCTRLALQRGRVIKWIIEVAALTAEEIKGLCGLVRGAVTANADVTDYGSVFIKSSTGFYQADGGKPNGATPESIKIMMECAAPLPVKAAGGVRSYDEAMAMINLGVKRIGTSSAKAIANGRPATEGY